MSFTAAVISYTATVNPVFPTVTIPIVAVEDPNGHGDRFHVYGGREWSHGSREVEYGYRDALFGCRGLYLAIPALRFCVS